MNISWEDASGVTSYAHAKSLDVSEEGLSLEVLKTIPTLAKPKSFAYAITAQADLYEALLEREGVTRYRLFAHDYGV